MTTAPPAKSDGIRTSQRNGGEVTRSSDSQTSVRWSRRALIVAFVAIFWVLPFIAGIIASGVAGDCDWESGSCSDVQSAGAFLVMALAFFWIFVSAPVTFLLGTAWLLSTLIRRGRRAANGDATAAGASLRSSADVSRRMGVVQEAYLWALAGVAWCVALVGLSVVASAEEASFPGLAALLFGSFIAVPLTVMLAVGWLARLLRRRFG